ncbi:hypothetical protein WR25_14243 isoform B [Diploscapter pachys]|nr:hypothetical protein WR25_14243 isoform B [Diploscapter pachys]
MNYARHDHSLVAANGKLYAIAGAQNVLCNKFCNSIEEYDPLTNEWKVVGENLVLRQNIERYLSEIEKKTPNDEPKPKRTKKDELGIMNMYQLNPPLLTDKDDSLISHPDFRLGNIRAAVIECGIFYMKDAGHGTKEIIRKTVVCLMAQLFKSDNTLMYTAAQEPEPGMTKFPDQICTKIAVGMIKLIEMKTNTAKMGSEIDVKISENKWKQLIYNEIKHVL